MTDTSQFRRREHLLTAGEQLLLARDPIDAAIRFSVFADATGVGAENLVVSPLCAMPLPRYPDPTGGTSWPAGRNRWAGARPEMMWHPLMWLPPRLAGRYTVTDDNGNELLEPDDLWALRLALELSASGLYDEESGTWLDVLSTVGIDIDMEGSRARLEFWLDGGADPALDTLDLTGMVVDDADPDWALDSALSMQDDLLEATAALGADSLVAALDDLAGYQEAGMSDRDVMEAAIRVGAMSEVFFYGLPPMVNDNGGLPDDVGFARAVVEEMTRMAASGVPVDEFVAGPATSLSDRLVEVRERFWPHLEQLMAEFASEETPAGRADSPVGTDASAGDTRPGGSSDGASGSEVRDEGAVLVDWGEWDSGR